MSFHNKLKSFLLPLAAVLIILALIFLPEIIGIKTSNEKSFEDRYKNKIFTVNKNSEEVPAETTATVEKQQQEESEDSGRGIGIWISKHLAESVKKERGDLTGQTEVSKLKVVPENLDSWEYIVTNIVQLKFKQAEDQARYFVRDLPLKYEKSKAAAEKFIRVLEVLQSKPEHKYTPRQIINQLEKADLSVVTSLLDELVPRSLLIKWNKINLAEFYKSEHVQKFKQIAAAGFEPRIQLAGVRYYMKKGAWQPEVNNLEKIEISIILLKDTLKSVKLLHNGRLLNNLERQKNSQEHSWIQVVSEIKDLSGLYTLQAEDIFGAKSFKSYNFNKGFSKFNLDQNLSKNGAYIYTAEINHNFQNSVNFIDQHYWHISEIERKLTDLFPSGQFERF